MTRVIVHAGFHKTGTSSLQDFIAQNHTALAPYLRYYSKPDLPAAGTAARLYGQRPYVWRRLGFRRAFRRFLAGIPDDPTIVISRETFGGIMPGHRDLFGRQINDMTATAIALAQEMTAAIHRRFGPQTEIVLLYTTRQTDSWMASVYGHLLRSIHLTTDFPEFLAGFEPLPDPQKSANRIAKALSPIPVHIARLEDFSDHPHGPAAAVLDLARVPDQARARLTRAAHKNPRQPASLEKEFLKLNRSNRPKNQLKQIKDQMLRDLNKGALA